MVQINSKRSHQSKKGQFFTPDIVADSMYQLSHINENSNVIDPSSGECIFLRIIHDNLKCANLYGIDLDPSIVHRTREKYGHFINIECANSLTEIQHIGIGYGLFDLVIGNPPYNGSTDKVSDTDILGQYDLGKKNGKLLKSQNIEILFMEQFIKLCKVGGEILVIIPDGILTNSSLRYVREYIIEYCFVNAVISLPRNTFHKDSGSGSTANAKTSILYLTKKCDLHEKQKQKTIMVDIENYEKELPVAVEEIKKVLG